MTFADLEKICSLLWGRSWQVELARAFNIDRRAVNGWKRQAVPRWVNEKLPVVIQKRKDEINSIK